MGVLPGESSLSAYLILCQYSPTQYNLYAIIWFYVVKY